MLAVPYDNMGTLSPVLTLSESQFSLMFIKDKNAHLLDLSMKAINKNWYLYMQRQWKELALWTLTQQIPRWFHYTLFEYPILQMRMCGFTEVKR